MKANEKKEHNSIFKGFPPPLHPPPQIYSVLSKEEDGNFINRIFSGAVLLLVPTRNMLWDILLKLV